MNEYMVCYEVDRISHTVRVLADNKNQVRRIIKNQYGSNTIILSIDKE